MSLPLSNALMALPGIVEVVGNRRAFKQLAAGTVLPALVHTFVSVDPRSYLNEAEGYEAMRLQINPLAETTAGVQQIHDAVRAELDGLAHVTLAGHRVIAVRRDIVGPPDRYTDDAGRTAWTWPRDYIVLYE
uniref:Uncharacterized protein n=1 Tax=biofilter metagenome TaxID=1070537 RepID=A0A1A7GE45_9ZZZZ